MPSLSPSPNESGDLIGVELDMNRGVLSFLKNGKHLGDCFSDLSKLVGGTTGVLPFVSLGQRGESISIYKRSLFPI